MRFSAVLAIFAASYAAAMPVDAKPDAGKGGDIAACETKAAADQVACINGCAKDAACITACAAVHLMRWCINESDKDMIKTWDRLIHKRR
ncbi:hypothetical protein Brms1b_006189 [Colletotrichum noveboracense]|nr:hypothetical protein CBS470a_010709 [Colletotrichum nupharicola]KAJ0315318.1 hypothetical protein Brms1b_006189 [Colletotrichum noveboracense]